MFYSKVNENVIWDVLSQMNGVTTQGENMADNGGMRQAFLAYKKHVADNRPDQRLPGLQQFSPEQLFFLGFATVSLEMQG
jgi:predicted metalloendopeptidase